MNSEDQVDRVLGSWLAGGPTELSDRSVAAIVDQLDNVKQRRSFRLPGTIAIPRLGLALGAAAVLVLAAALALSFYANRPAIIGPAPTPSASPSPSPTPLSPFEGAWISTADADGGTQTMTVETSPGGEVSIVVYDDIASVCSLTPSTMTGEGRVEARQLIIPTPDYTCDDGSEPHLTNGDLTPLNEVLRNLTYVYHPNSDTLSVGGARWHREGGEAPSAEPSLEPSPSPILAPSPTPSPRHSARPGEATFTSLIHGISLDYPSEWRTRPATQDWTGGELSFDSLEADVIYDPTLGDHLYLLIASQPYGGAGGDAWRDGVRDWTCADGFHEFWGWTVDGYHSEQFGPCNSGSLIKTSSRGYLIRLVASSGEPGLADTYNWDWLMPLLDTVDLRPDDAQDAPIPAPSPNPPASPSTAPSAAK